MTGHVPEFGGYDAKTVGHDGPKYAGVPISAVLTGANVHGSRVA